MVAARGASKKDCTKSAAGSTGKCKTHGGGNRCTEKGCTKSARNRSDKCVAHGGGRGALQRAVPSRHETR
eukprot:39697-Eustigmatos_ZCMA.PRE.1